MRDKTLNVSEAQEVAREGMRKCLAQPAPHWSLPDIQCLRALAAAAVNALNESGALTDMGIDAATAWDMGHLNVCTGCNCDLDRINPYRRAR